MNRSSNPSIAELRAVTQPASITGRSNAEHWVADLYLRRLSPYVTRLLLKTPITANEVTYLMILTGISISCALLISGSKGLLLALLLSQLQMLWDCCDGEIARWRNTQSPKGVFLDRLGHYLAEGLIPIALALRIIGWPNKSVSDYKLLFLAALISLLILFNKALNDSVHVARAFSGLPKNADAREVGVPQNTLIRILRLPFKVLAVQRLFHSVEMTFVIVIFQGNKSLIDFGLYLAIFVTIGHLVAILSSKKLAGEAS